MEFTDKAGRLIDIEFDGCFSIAKHHGNEVGRISFYWDEEDYGPGKMTLSTMNVNPEYRRSGIGTELMRAAVADIGKDFERPDFLAVGGSQARSSEDYFTDDGMAFFRHLFKCEVINDKPSRHTPIDPYDFDDE